MKKINIDLNKIITGNKNEVTGVAKAKKMVKILVCGRCNIEPVTREVVERQMKDEKGKLLARTTSSIQCCPKCFNQGNFKYVFSSLVKKYKNANSHS